MHRLNSQLEQVKNWLSAASEEERKAYTAALLEISSRKGSELGANTVPLPGHSNRRATRMSTGHYVVWADLADYKSYFNVMFVGQLELDQ